ncbi:uncharacterized protein RCO7_14006 [Rhynchosporium graminicola]|uniref:Uncharacterized protein n=1 Tax=Rhynchosporium graminicola TaxID=2792576 RepID=A0A1E1JSJ1_9HELO|nr:uncharacterized protein RCO7_14006 [Rhynchosporium commune]
MHALGKDADAASFLHHPSLPSDPITTSHRINQLLDGISTRRRLPEHQDSGVRLLRASRVARSESLSLRTDTMRWSAASFILLDWHEHIEEDDDDQDEDELRSVSCDHEMNITRPNPGH